MTTKLALIDYGAGNLHSVHNALKAAGAGNVVVTADPESVIQAERIVLPGVGAFAHCMEAISSIEGMIEALDYKIWFDGVPFLGICVGMQLLAEFGVEHGTTKGLCWLGGTVCAIEPADGLKVPHMGWNEVTPMPDAPLIEAGEAYFLHGYHYNAAIASDIIATTDHGGSLVAAIGRDNIIGVQFHPEKSQAYGINFLKRFLEWKP